MQNGSGEERLAMFAPARENDRISNDEAPSGFSAFFDPADEPFDVVEERVGRFLASLDR